MLVYIRKGEKQKDDLIIALNMTPVPRESYKMGVPRPGKLKEVFNSDKKKYFGSGSYKNKVQTTTNEAWQFRDQSVSIHIPPLGAIVLKYS